MKKIGIFIGVIALLFIVGVSLIPMFYKIDDLRPEIKKQIELQVRGKVDLGELSLSTFPKLSVSVGKSKFTAPAPFNKQDFIEFDEAAVSIPLYSLLFSPHIDLELKNPKIIIISNSTTSNLAAFLPGEVAATTNSAEESNATKAAGTEADPLGAMPGFLKARVLKATVSVILDGANIILKDLANSKSDGISLSNLDLKLENIGLNSPMALHFETVLALVKEDMKINGPILADGEINVSSNGKVFDIKYEINNDMSDLEIVMGSIFKKASGVDFNISLKGKAKKSESLSATVDALNFKFAGLSVLSSLSVERAGEPDSTFDFKLNSKDLALSGLGALLPMAKSYSLDGSVSMNGSASGRVAQPKFDFAINLKNVTGKTPELSLPIEKLNGKIKISGTPDYPIVNIDPFNLKIGTSDLALALLAKGIERPDVSISVTANRFNVDELLGTQSNEEAQKTASAGGAGSTSNEAVSTEPLDESLDKMAPELDKALTNPMLDKLQANVKIVAKSMRMVGGEFTNARVNMGYKSRVLNIKDVGINGYKGSFDLNGKMNLVPKVTSYSINSNLKNISISEALKVHMPSWKDEISGNINGKFDIAGTGLRKKQLEKSLRGGLKGNIKNGRTSIPIVKLISGVLEKLPKKVQNPAEKKAGNKVFNGEFKTMKLDSSIKGRMINLNVLDVIFAAKDAGLGDMRFKGDGTISFDRMADLKGVAYIAPSVLPVKELKGPSGQVEIPLKFKGDISDPKADIAYSVKILGPRMAKSFIKSDAGKKIETKLKQEVKKLKIPADLKKKFGF